MDYGHALQFGTFITPSAAQPHAVVASARLSEDLGFDLATFQDHPYQPALLDTWTLLSYVAAATTSIRVSPNVLSLPLRPAAVTARAAASLDLLSGGRVELGLGAGAFWDAIEAMGARRLTPGQAVDALSEAIDVIRGIWASDERGSVSGGEYYPVHGAKRGPAPAHDIAIWLGAYKPRMLQLVARKADGWLPSQPYLQPGDLKDGNARIDDAAVDAGRQPGEIRRLLNVSGRESLDQLAALALEDGVSTFIITGDDPATMQRFAEESIPALRDAVTAERTRTGATPVTRSARVLAARRPGIAYDALPDSLRGTAVEPGDVDYRSVRSTYTRGGAPGLVIRPTTVAELADALAFARLHRHVPLGIRSGGHGISGRSTNDGGIVIDLKKLSSIEVVDEVNRRVRIGPGARWMDVATALEKYGWAISSGDYGGVGVGGLATAGGIGLLAREHGLTIDRLVAADVMLADGSIVHASAAEHPDLFWALRGAGANMGVVVSFEFEADPVGDLGLVDLTFDASDTAGFLREFGRVMEEAPRDVTMFLIVGGGRSGQPAARMYGVVDSPDPDTILARLQPFTQLAPIVGQSVQLSSYATVMANASDTTHDGQGEPNFRSGLVRHLNEEVANAAADLVSSGTTPWFQIRSVGGAVADVDPDATAYAHRDANFAITAIGASAEFDRLWDTLARHFTGLYLSFETRADKDTLQRAFPPQTLARLRSIKDRYDPDGLFRDNFSVTLLDAGTDALGGDRKRR